MEPRSINAHLALHRTKLGNDVVDETVLSPIASHPCVKK